MRSFSRAVFWLVAPITLSIVLLGFIMATASLAQRDMMILTNLRQWMTELANHTA